MAQILQIISNTPLWVYILFIFLINIGIKASKPSEVSLLKISILPVIFTYLSFHSLISQTSVSTSNITVLMISLIVGVFGGILQSKKIGYSYNRKTKKIESPGTWTTLILILLIFVTKFYFGYMIAAHPSILIKNHMFDVSYIFICGICSGLFIGRFIYSLFLVEKSKRKD